MASLPTLLLTTCGDIARHDAQRMVMWVNLGKLIFSIVRSSTCSHTHSLKSSAIAAFNTIFDELAPNTKDFVCDTAANLRVFGTVCVSLGPPEVNSMHFHPCVE